MVFMLMPKSNHALFAAETAKLVQERLVIVLPAGLGNISIITVPVSVIVGLGSIPIIRLVHANFAMRIALSA